MFHTLAQIKFKFRNVTGISKAFSIQFWIVHSPDFTIFNPVIDWLIVLYLTFLLLILFYFIWDYYDRQAP